MGKRPTTMAKTKLIVQEYFHLCVQQKLVVVRISYITVEKEGNL